MVLDRPFRKWDTLGMDNQALIVAATVRLNAAMNFPVTPVIKDRMLQVAKENGPFRFMHHINCVTHQPVGTSRAKALRLSAETAETIRFNLTARGFRVRMVFA